MQRFILLCLLSGWVWPVCGATNVPASLHCLSLRLQSATDKVPFGPTYKMEISTVETGAPNGELMPVWDPEVSYDHATMFLLSQSGSAAVTFGDLYLNVPDGGDRNGNGFNDFFEIGQEITALATTGHYVDSSNVEGEVTAVWNRAANFRTGTCRLQFSGKITRTFTHLFELFQFAGTLDYLLVDKNAVGGVRLTDAANNTNFIGGSISLVRTNADLITLRAGTWTNNTGATLAYAANDPLQRHATNYLGFLDFPDTGDYLTWMLVISDPNDANRNGIPDLSDLLPATVPAPILGLRQSADQMLLSIIGQVGIRYQIERSTALGQTNWTPIQSVLLTNIPCYLSWPKSAEAAVFWRAKVQ